ncbi:MULTISPECIES: beta-propeller fold lactonase family protein [unclassified Bradyrhizobium]|uniref:beta-propeller fold lactonase family protein n=1 Tax=unclassified Bradyrhizobium TaxID=2631580 RepID=UPI00040D138E|nr:MULTISPECIES: beta-propeller fold lactonase family protein [unclassified Bradyrhizobium]MCP3464070.1 lactonase family protein [Bradyrhizobium sp. CCGUVB23]
MQFVGPIHVHPNGRFVYLANRSDGTVEFAGRKVHGDGENSVAVFSIDPASGEPTLIQTIDTQTFHCRTFSIHPSGRMLVTAAVVPLDVRQGDNVQTSRVDRLFRW